MKVHLFRSMPPGGREWTYSVLLPCESTPIVLLIDDGAYGPHRAELHARLERDTKGAYWHLDPRGGPFSPDDQTLSVKAEIAVKDADWLKEMERRPAFFCNEGACR